MNHYATILGYVVLCVGGFAIVAIASWGAILWVLEIPILKKKTRVIMRLGIEAYKRGER